MDQHVGAGQRPGHHRRVADVADHRHAGAGPQVDPADVVAVREEALGEPGAEHARGAGDRDHHWELTFCLRNRVTRWPSPLPSTSPSASTVRSTSAGSVTSEGPMISGLRPLRV